MLERYKQTKFYHGWVKFCNDLRPMNWKQRLEYLWMYYKEYAYLVSLVLVAVVLTVTIIINRSKNTLVSGMMINISVDPLGMSYMKEEYQNDIAPGDKWNIVELDYTNFGDMEDLEFGEHSFYASQILLARVSGQMLDYIIMDKFAMEYYIAQDVYLDLREFFTPEELADLEAQNRVIWAMQEGDTDRWPIAIKITDIPYVKDNVKNEGDIYFALSGHVRDMDACRSAWERLNAWESKTEE